MKLVLIIDDEEDIRSIIKDRCEFEGYEVLETGKGSEGLRLALGRTPDIVLLDLMMPAMSGYQVWREFQEDPVLKKVPILIITAKSHATDTYWGGRISPKDYIHKPFNMDRLLLRMKEKMGA